jgi:type VI secretion system protein ImpG
VSALCTNRALPLLLRTGEDAAEFTEQSGAPVSNVRCLAGPTAPRSSGVFGDVAWGLLSHLSLDYASLMGRDGQAANSLRQLLRLYANFANRSTEACIDGIVDVQTSGVVRPLAGPGPLTFGRGVEVTVTCDESAFAGTSAFLLGAVLSRFFAKYASINSFAETVLRTQQRGAVMRWPVTRGRRPTL